MKKFSTILVSLSLVITGHLRGQSLEVTAKGTGNTTGHIATLTVNNKGNSPVNILQQSVYIPSDGQYQSYISVIPATTVPPGKTTIPIDGYCADVHTPPVPGNDPMPPIATWIPVGDPNAIIPEGSINLIPSLPVSPFDPAGIPGITTSPWYTPVAPNPEAEIIITWPGTDTPVGGIFNPQKDPKTFAPVIIEALAKISETYDKLKEEGKVSTPFSIDPEKEREAVIQQTLWIITTDITGGEYDRDDFTVKVYDQFRTTTGKDVNSLPAEEKEQLNAGVDDFWNVFTAVGVEAKVLSVGDPSTIGNVDKCNCGKTAMTLYYPLVPGKEEGAPFTYKTKKENQDKDTPDTLNIKSKPDKIKVKPGDKITIRVESLEITCDKCNGTDCLLKDKKLVMLAEGIKDPAKGKERELKAKKKAKDDKFPTIDAYEDVNVEIVKGNTSVIITYRITWKCELPKCTSSGVCTQDYTLVVLRM